MSRRYLVTRRVVRVLFWTAAGAALPAVLVGASWLVQVTS